MFSYRSILKQAWVIVWNNKYLWFFGLFASLTLAGGSIEYQFINQTFKQGVISSSYQGLNTWLALSETFQMVWWGLIDLFKQNIIVIINSLTILLLTLTLITVFVWFAITSQAALIDGVKKVLSAKKKINISSIRAGLTVGNQHFWPVLWLNILIKILISFAFFLISLPLLFLAISDNSVFLIAYTILFTIFVPVAVSLSLLVKYAISARVLENKSITSSLEKAYSLFKKNWLISLELALLLFLISLVSSGLILIMLAIIVYPFAWLGLVLSLNWLVVLMLILALLAIIIFGSILTSFQIASWTNLYIHINDNKGVSKLERIFHKK